MRGFNINRGDIMPNRDKTGPEGGGSRTGRGMGDCPPTTRSKRDGRLGRANRRGRRGR